VAGTSYDRGDPLDLFPKYSLTVSADREFRWRGHNGFVRLDYSQQGRETFRNRNVAGPTPWYFGESDVVHTLNANVGLHWSDNLRVGIFAQNLTNDRGLIAPYSPNGESDSEIRARPRTGGADVSVSLN
jgi:hypothetical protein